MANRSFHGHWHPSSQNQLVFLTNNLSRTRRRLRRAQRDTVAWSQECDVIAFNNVHLLRNEAKQQKHNVMLEQLNMKLSLECFEIRRQLNKASVVLGMDSITKSLSQRVTMLVEAVADQNAKLYKENSELVEELEEWNLDRRFEEMTKSIELSEAQQRSDGDCEEDDSDGQGEEADMLYDEEEGGDEDDEDETELNREFKTLTRLIAVSCDFEQSYAPHDVHAMTRDWIEDEIIW